MAIARRVEEQPAAIRPLADAHRASLSFRREQFGSQPANALSYGLQVFDSFVVPNDLARLLPKGTP